MLDRFTSFHMPVSVVGKSCCLARVWCYSAQASDSAAPSEAGRDKKVSQGKPWAYAFMALQAADRTHNYYLNRSANDASWILHRRTH